MDRIQGGWIVGKPRIPRTDQEVLAAVRTALLSEPLLGPYLVRPDGDGATPRAAVLFPEGCSGVIDIEVEDGVICLRGQADSPEDRQLAGVLASRVPGCRGVVNDLSVAGA
jgi:hypothetical protein